MINNKETFRRGFTNQKKHIFTISSELAVMKLVIAKLITKKSSLAATQPMRSQS